MAVTELTSAFKNIRGKLNKNERIILRQKKYRAENGAILNYASQEAYEVQNPRNYKKNPPKGQELLNISLFAQASRLTTLILQAGKYTAEELSAMTPERREETLRYRAQLEDFKTRFKAQYKTPDPQAPLLANTDPAYNHHSVKTQRKQYLTLNTFIRAMLLQTLKSR